MQYANSSLRSTSDWTKSQIRDQAQGVADCEGYPLGPVSVPAVTEETNALGIHQ
jgi:hypothetical protein